MPRLRKTRPAAVVTVTYNVGNASARRVRADLLALAALGPDVIALEEVGDRHDTITDVPGYRTHTDRSMPSSGHLALLVRADLPQRRLRCEQISPATDVERIVAGARHDGRCEAKYVLSIRVRVAGQWHRVGVTHLVPSSMKRGAPKARALYRRQARAAAAWLAVTRRRVLLGDFNGEPTYRLLAAVRRVAHALSARSHGRRSIDLTWLRRNYRGRAVALDGYSSDHRPVWTVWRRVR